MALSFSVEYPIAEGTKGGRHVLPFNSEQQYFKINFSGALSTDKIYIDEFQDGANWTNLATITIGTSGSGSIKDLIGDFVVNGSLIRVVGKNSIGSTTYQTSTYISANKNPKTIKDLNQQVTDLYVHGAKHTVKDVRSRIFLPSLEDTVSLINAEDNSVLSSSVLNSSLDLAANNLDVLPKTLQIVAMRNDPKTFINGVELKSFPVTTNSQISGAGGTITGTNKPFFIGDNKVYTFSAVSSDGGLTNGRKFLKVFKAAMGKNLYRAIAHDVGSADFHYGTYVAQRDTYNSIASSKTTELF